MDRTGEGERRLIMANRAELKDGGRRGLSLDLDGAFVQASKEIVREDYDYASSEFLRYWVPQEDLIQAVSSVGPREMSSTDVRAEIRTKEADRGALLNENFRRIMAQALLLESSLRRGPGGEEWNRRENLFNAFARETEAVLSIKNDRNILIYWLEYYKKFSIPFGALSFVFLAVSLGLLAKKSGQTVGFIFGLLIAVMYWALLLGGQTLGIRLGYSPFWSMWLPNILALSTGFVMALVRVRR
jgi:lipopolysaccharide export system permease protein